MVILHTLYIHN